ncbi:MULTISPECIES: hypothetical protein [unclassified Pseudocitrobacter]|uniref:hypothetical protein n=1 Tax=unclassified Pseudocitrobacter TaxID=2638778 RepID=UPI0023E43CCD|nr:MULTISPECIES: hypothetical protein [unclassified Pseudocitrobacter]MDF3827564.1 hypothetical protein [Pseudocitrobacter sp. 2023EL-00150]MEC5374176.1 hypothetical protein [Pseudocitrobacter sp. MW920760]
MKSVNAICLYLMLPGAVMAAWPTIQEVHQRFPQTADSLLLEQPILLATGEKRYVLGCMHQKQADVYQGDWGNFSAMFQCKFRDLTDDSDILQPTDHWGSTVTRARFYASDVIGGCRDHRWYGHRREFHVRGMKVVLDIVDFVPGSTIKTFYDQYRFTLNVDVINDTTATSAWGGLAAEMCRAETEGFDKDGHFIDRVDTIRGDSAF